MKFLHAEYIPVLLLVASFLFFFLRKSILGFSKWIREVWFYRLKKRFFLAQFLYFLGVLFFLFSLLDLRGKGELVEISIPDQRTIILIDSSSSMLVEDVRPSRLSRAVVMARHIVKKAVGNQIAVVLFSDIPKRLVPFTDDLDLLDSRLSALDEKIVSNGGSLLAPAIMESLQYLKLEAGKKQVSGNILLFSDAESHSQSIEVLLPESVNLAVVGIGTEKGGRIPMRGKDGRFLGYKQYRGKEVVSQLDRAYLEKLGEKAPSYRYWVTNSFSMPTEEVLQFFREKFRAQLASGNMLIEPVKGHFLVLVGVALLILSYLLSWGRVFFFQAILLGLFMLPAQGQGPNNAMDSQLKEEERKEKVEKLLSQLSEEDRTLEEKYYIAAELFRWGEGKKAIELYEENLPQDIYSENKLVLFNYASALLAEGKIKEGLEIMHYLRKSLEFSNDEKLLKALKNNILRAFKRDQKEGEKEGEKEGNKSEKDSQQEDGEGKEGERDQMNQDEHKKSESNSLKDLNQDKENKENKKDKEDQEGKGEEKVPEEKVPEEKGKNDEKRNNPKDNGRKENLENLENKESQIKNRRKEVKVPAILKQIMDEDRHLQKKYMDTSTENNSLEKKDW